MKRVLFALMLTPVVSIALSGCGLFGNPPNSEEPVDEQTLQILLEADWELFAWGTPDNPQGTIDGTQITLAFSSEGDGKTGSVSGSAGCNEFGGSYEISASSLEISELYLTRKYCANPEGVMDQENRFVNALESVTSLDLMGGQLDLNYGMGGEKLFFVGTLP